jgi:hypothetical protein
MVVRAGRERSSSSSAPASEGSAGTVSGTHPVSTSSTVGAGPLAPPGGGTVLASGSPSGRSGSFGVGTGGVASV